MPYVDTVGDVWKVTMGFSYTNSQVQEPGFSLAIVSSGGGDSRAALAGQVDALVAAHILPYLDPLANYDGCKISREISAFKWAPVVTTGPVAGTSSFASLPTQCRVLTRLKTAFVGREFRGRVFGCTPTTDQQDTDLHPAPQILAKWFTVLDTFRAGLTVGGTLWKLCVFHRAKPPAVPASYDLVTQVSSIKEWGTQRRGGDFGRKNQSPPW